MLMAARQGFKEDNSLQVNKILVGFLTSQDVFFKMLNKGELQWWPESDNI